MSDDDDKWRYQAHLDDRQADAWMEFVMSGRPGALATYLEADGEVDASVRQILIDILRNRHRANNVSGKDRWRDYVTYVMVGGIMALEDLNKTDACKKYAKNPKQELRTVEKQFDRGSKVLSPGSDVFKSGGTSTET